MQGYHGQSFVQNGIVFRWEGVDVYYTDVFGRNWYGDEVGNRMQTLPEVEVVDQDRSRRDYFNLWAGYISNRKGDDFVSESDASGQGGRFPLDERVNSYLEYPGRFGDSRDGGSRKHGGADLYAPVGTNVYAVKGGTVIQNPYKFYRGSYAIEVNHGNFVARYSEINVASGLRAGSIITQGQLKGTVADLSLNKSMLHFEMYSGSATGPLTNRANLPYMRRSDLIDPTHFLNFGY